MAFLMFGNAIIMTLVLEFSFSHFFMTNIWQMQVVLYVVNVCLDLVFTNFVHECQLVIPLNVTQAIVGKFLAAWLFIALAMTLTIPTMVATTCYLGNPDMGVILCGYVGSVLMAGAYVATGHSVWGILNAPAPARRWRNCSWMARRGWICRRSIQLGWRCCKRARWNEWKRLALFVVLAPVYSIPVKARFE